MKRTFSSLPKGFAITLLLVGSSLLVQAQASDNSTLNVVLSDVRSIIVNPAQNSVQLDFVTAQDYQRGVFNREVAHLEVTSTAGYHIKVKAATEFLQNGANTIPVNTIKLDPALNAGYEDPGLETVTIQLSSVPALIIACPYGSSRIVFDVIYSASGGEAYIGKPAGTYSTTITYSIEPM